MKTALVFGIINKIKRGRSDNNNMKKNKCVGKRTGCILLVVCFLFISLTGCGSSTDVSVSTLQLHKDGSITQIIVEDFPEEEYNFEELMQMNQQEVDDYNESVSKEAVRINQMKLDDKNVVVDMEYTGANAYFGLNGTVLYFGTVDQAKAAGYDLNVTLNSVSKDETLSPEELKEMGNRHIAIVNEAVDVLTYGKILYVSDGVTAGKNKKLATVAEDETAYIVFK